MCGWVCSVVYHSQYLLLMAFLEPRCYSLVFDEQCFVTCCLCTSCASVAVDLFNAVWSGASVWVGLSTQDWIITSSNISRSNNVSSWTLVQWRWLNLVDIWPWPLTLRAVSVFCPHPSTPVSEVLDCHAANPVKVSLLYISQMRCCVGLRHSLRKWVIIIIIIIIRVYLNRPELILSRGCGLAAQSWS